MKEVAQALLVGTWVAALVVFLTGDTLVLVLGCACVIVTNCVSLIALDME